MKFYVMSDIHGFYTPMIKALEDAGFFSDEGEKKVIVCGDMLDRGKDAIKISEFMWELEQKGQLIFISGNHEELMMQALQEIASGGVYEIGGGMSIHCYNGTWGSLLQLAQMNANDGVRYPYQLISKVRSSIFYSKLLLKCVDYYETENYIFCHGWIPVHISGFKPYERYRYMDNWREAEAEHWKKARWLNGMDLACLHHITEPNKTIVCGHFYTSYGHAKFHNEGSKDGPDAITAPFIDEGIIAIDACTAASDTVNCIVINDNAQ